MQTPKLVFTVIMALILMGCPPPVSDNPDNPAPIRKHHVAQVSSGVFHSMIVKTDGTLWAVGNDDAERLGNGSTDQKLNPVQVNEIPIGGGAPQPMTNVAQVSSGGTHSMILKKDDSLWAVGSNRFGQLGNNSATQQVNPIHIINEVAQVSSGGTHSMILKKDSSLWAVGANLAGQLGDGSSLGKSTLVQVMEIPVAGNPAQPMTNVARISSGNAHSMILKKDDTLWAVGVNFYGQLGNGSTMTESNPVQVMEIPAAGGSAQPMTNVKQISAGGNHSMILKKDDTLWAVGNNLFGQLGTGSTDRKLHPGQVMIEVAYVSAGYNHSMIVKKDGTLWAVGSNASGQLGDGSTTTRLDPVQVMEIPAGGSPARPMTAVARVSSGYNHSMIVKTDGTLWAVGSNASGQLGNGDEKLATKLNPEQITPVAGCHDYLPWLFATVIITEE